MSLPIRQGKLFPSAQPPSKKFGRHCATIKYRFSIAPLFIAHAYRQDQDKEDIKKGKARVLGVKGKIARFNVDLHQRSQEESVYKPEMKMRRKRMRKAFYQAEVDCEGVDLRVIEGVFNEPELKVVLRMDEDEDVNADSPSEDDLTISYDDLEWHDRVDFLDLFSTLLDLTPRIRVLRCLTCPRFTYYRQPPNRMRLPGSYSNRETDSSEIREEEDMHTKFGQEDSHTCFIGQTRGQLQQEGEHAGLPAGSKSNLYEADQPWINRIVVHSPTVFISNDIRTLALKYYYSSRRSKGNSCEYFVNHIAFSGRLTQRCYFDRPTIAQPAQIHSRPLQRACKERREPGPSQIVDDARIPLGIEAEESSRHSRRNDGRPERFDSRGWNPRLQCSYSAGDRRECRD